MERLAEAGRRSRSRTAAPLGSRPTRWPSRPREVRAAPNRREVLRTVRARLRASPCAPCRARWGAELTFLGARRWMGWQGGRSPCSIIGGGSPGGRLGPRPAARLRGLAAAWGRARLTHEFLDGGEDAPRPEQVRALRRKVRHQLRDVAARIRWEGPRTAVATSRTFQQLRRLCGALPGRLGPFVERQMRCSDLGEAIGRLAALSAAERARLPGISAPRAAQVWPGRWSGTRR
ncbi:hypothetical protein LV779_21275 [Streptomyces thinghirensis]|nr:hypothetical protein [Streptomyces thinghirensis]